MRRWAGRDVAVVLGRAADQKPAASTLRHVDRIGELMEADDDDDEMTSDSCRRSLDKHDQDDDCVVGGPGGGAASPRADTGASCVHRSDGAIGCHGDDDESDELQRRTDEESLLTQLPQQQQQQQQSTTGGYSLSHNFLFFCPSCVCTYVSVRFYVRVWMPMAGGS